MKKKTKQKVKHRTTKDLIFDRIIQSFDIDGRFTGVLKSPSFLFIIKELVRDDKSTPSGRSPTSKHSTDPNETQRVGRDLVHQSTPCKKSTDTVFILSCSS